MCGAWEEQNTQVFPPLLGYRWPWSSGNNPNLGGFKAVSKALDIVFEV